MVATRRSVANAVPTGDPPKPAKRQKSTVSSIPVKSDEYASIQPSISQTSLLVTNNTRLSKPSNELSECTLTPPWTGRTPQKRPPNISGHSTHTTDELSIGSSIPASQSLVVLGTSTNPISLLEDSPQSKEKGKSKQLRMAPHEFQNRYKKLCTYEAPRNALAPIAANGSTFPGQLGPHLHHMRAAKTGLPARIKKQPQHAQFDIPFEKRYPVSAQYLAPSVRNPHSPSKPALKDITPPPPPPPPPPQYMLLPQLSEQQSRDKGVQCIQDHSRPSLHNTGITGCLEKTSDAGSGAADKNHAVTAMKSTTDDARLNGDSITVLPDPHFQLAHLIEQASLLTSLLQLYPQSANQRGLREDIARLATVQNQHLADWLNFEVGQSRKTANLHGPRVSRSAITSPKKALAPLHMAEVKRKKGQDDEIRSLLSANAALWQDGSGQSVADVYADMRTSTPVDSVGSDDIEDKAVAGVSTPVRGIVKIQSGVSEPGEVESSPVSYAHLFSEVAADKRSTCLTGVSSPGTSRTASLPELRTRTGTG